MPSVRELWASNFVMNVGYRFGSGFRFTRESRRDVPVRKEDSERRRF